MCCNSVASRYAFRNRDADHGDYCVLGDGESTFVMRWQPAKPNVAISSSKARAQWNRTSLFCFLGFGSCFGTWIPWKEIYLLLCSVWEPMANTERLLPDRMPCAMQLRRRALRRCRTPNGSSGSCKRCGSYTAAHIRQWIFSPAAAPWWEKWVYSVGHTLRTQSVFQFFFIHLEHRFAAGEIHPNCSKWRLRTCSKWAT